MRKLISVSVLVSAMSVCAPSKLDAADCRPVRSVLITARERIRETLSAACHMLANVMHRVRPTATLHLDGKNGPRIEFSYRFVEY